MSTERTTLPVIESAGCCGGATAAASEPAPASCCSTPASADNPTT